MDFIFYIYIDHCRTLRHEAIDIGVGSGLDWNSVGRGCPLPPLVVSVKSEIIIGIDKIYAPRIGERKQFT